MRFAAITTFFLAGLSIASPVKRDIATINNALDDVTSKINGLNSAVQAFQGAGQADALRSAVTAVKTSISNGNTAIAATSPVSLSEAFGLVSKVDGVTAAINTAVDSAIAKKDAFSSAGVTGEVATAFSDFKSGATTLGATISSKVPSGAKPIADGKVSEILAAIQRGADAFPA